MNELASTKRKHLSLVFLVGKTRQSMGLTWRPLWLAVSFLTVYWKTRGQTKHRDRSIFLLQSSLPRFFVSSLNKLDHARIKTQPSLQGDHYTNVLSLLQLMINRKSPRDIRQTKRSRNKPVQSKYPKNELEAGWLLSITLLKKNSVQLVFLLNIIFKNKIGSFRHFIILFHWWKYFFQKRKSSE